MIRWISRVAMALVSLLALARAAAAHEPAPPPPGYAPAYAGQPAAGHGYGEAYIAGDPRGAAEAQIFVQEQDGRWRRVSGEPSGDRYGAGYGYRPAPGGCCAPPPCATCCGQGYPSESPACSGEVHLGDSFFWGGGGVGPETVYSGGGGGGGYAYAGAAAGASAYASASASARVSFGGGHRPPPHRPPPPRGGCGCH
ncbi:MAG: hypothetical protein WC068_09180 [Caulobacter sp.]